MGVEFVCIHVENGSFFFFFVDFVSHAIIKNVSGKCKDRFIVVLIILDEFLNKIKGKLHE